MRYLQQNKRASPKHYKEARKEANKVYKPRKKLSKQQNNANRQIDEANTRKERNFLKT